MGQPPIPPGPEGPGFPEALVTEAQHLSRLSVPALDALLGKAFQVLDHGFVRVIDYMGSDAAIVQAARISYGAGTKQVHEDRGLIRYLMRHHHTTPLEMCVLKLHVRVPMDTWRQWIRTRMASVNEYSTRYSVAIDAMQTTFPMRWRQQASGNRQGSHGYIAEYEGYELSQEEQAFHQQARSLYNQRLALGVAREQARKDLPLSTYTEAYWKIDLHNLLHFLRLRMDAHAQEEIRAYATIIGEKIVQRWCPLTWEAFIDYHLEGMQFSRLELAELAHILSQVRGNLPYEPTRSLQGREAEELAAKLRRLNHLMTERSDDADASRP